MKSFKIGNGYINSNGVYKRNVSNKKNQKGGRVTMSSQYFGRNTDKYYPAGSSELVHQGNKTLAGHDLSPSQPNNTLTGLQTGGGRTLPSANDVVGTMPGPTFNGGVTTGEACVGSHCSIPVTPETQNLIHNNLNSSTPGANVSYPGTTRMGNNLQRMPGVTNYGNGTNIKCTQTGGNKTLAGHDLSPSQPNNTLTGLQTGGRNDPFDFIFDPNTNKKVSIYGKRGQEILKDYVKEIEKNN